MTWRNLTFGAGLRAEMLGLGAWLDLDLFPAERGEAGGGGFFVIVGPFLFSVKWTNEEVGQ